MADMMQMDDARPFATLSFDQLEARDTHSGTAAVWDLEGWYGGDYNKVRLRSEGERLDGVTSDASVELLWDCIVARWWSLQLGARHDLGDGPGRTWAALGIEGTAPYGIATQATVYIGEEGRTSARLKLEYDLYLTQRWILQPKVELNVYSSADPERRLGAGLSDAEIGIRMRYEFRREFAPYVGLDWLRLAGSTSELRRAVGSSASDLQFVAGLKFWF
jgi:copper resistance protein B